MRKNTVEGFWSKVQVGTPDECWTWKLSTNRREGGYGQTTLAGEKMFAHVLAYRLSYGAVPSGMEVTHSCDNPLCCNPRHLVAKTHKENMKDCMIHGKWSSERNKSREKRIERFSAIASKENVTSNIFNLRKQGVVLKKIGELVGLSESAVCYILKGKRRNGGASGIERARIAKTINQQAA